MNGLGRAPNTNPTFASFLIATHAIRICARGHFFQNGINHRLTPIFRVAYVAVAVLPTDEKPSPVHVGSLNLMATVLSPSAVTKSLQQTNGANRERELFPIQYACTQKYCCKFMKTGYFLMNSTPRDLTGSLVIPLYYGTYQNQVNPSNRKEICFR
jgi:hypothetical protein